MVMPNALSLVATRAEINDSAHLHRPATTLWDNPSSTSKRNTEPSGAFRSFGPVSRRFNSKTLFLLRSR